MEFDDMIYLREWRLIRGMTQQELAGRCRVRRATISDLESHKREPMQATLEKLQDALGIELRQLKRDPFKRLRR